MAGKTGVIPVGSITVFTAQFYHTKISHLFYTIISLMTLRRTAETMSNHELDTNVRKFDDKCSHDMLFLKYTNVIMKHMLNESNLMKPSCSLHNS